MIVTTVRYVGDWYPMSTDTWTPNAWEVEAECGPAVVNAVCLRPLNHPDLDVTEQEDRLTDSLLHAYAENR